MERNKEDNICQASGTGIGMAASPSPPELQNRALKLSLCKSHILPPLHFLTVTEDGSLRGESIRTGSKLFHPGQFQLENQALDRREEKLLKD